MSNLSKTDWETLERLRAGFLEERSGTDYWESPRDLQLYDQFYAARIGWKWDSVLREIKRRGFQPHDSLTLVDWGCGTGIATRRFLAAFPEVAIDKIIFWDQSPLASAFAQKQIAQESVVSSEVPPHAALLISHVATELSPRALERLLQVAMTADYVFWVEPGTSESGRTIVALREKLREHFQILAPCPHQDRCRLGEPENARHWCHHFARVPNEAFTDRDWKAFNTRLKIDLRSLPLSYLVLQNKTILTTVPLPEKRVLGRPNVQKGRVETLVCRRESLRKERKLRREFQSSWKDLKTPFTLDTGLKLN